MVRPLRIEFAGAVYHITSRGARQEDIDLDVGDRKLWLNVLAEVLFQGRYKAILVDKESYLLEVSRYVVLNPLRAKMVNRLSDWEWSSYKAMIGRASADEWLEIDWILSRFGRSRKQAVKGYVEFVNAGKGVVPVWDNKIHPAILGDETFIESIYKAYVDDAKSEIQEFNRVERRRSPASLESYFTSNSDRAGAIRNAYKTGGFTMKEIAEYCGVHYSTVSRVINCQ